MTDLISQLLTYGGFVEQALALPGSASYKNLSLVQYKEGVYILKTFFVM